MNFNIKVKELVSKNKRRFVNDEYNLDLSYICRNIIAMGFPSERIEGMYRNHIGDVSKFMEQYHKGHYKIYNLRRDGTYDTSKFHGRVMQYPMDDHHPPSLLLMRPFCEDVHSWLSLDDNNVVAIHCKAGKGRTGVMICAYLLYRGMFSQPIDALRYYGEKRTMDMNGVTIPSQRRYVEYFNGLLKTGLTPHKVPMIIRSVHIESVVTDTSRPFAAYFAMYSAGKRVYKSAPREFYFGDNEVPSVNNSDETSTADRVLIKQDRPLVLNLTVPKEDHPILISGDVRVDIFQKTGRIKIKKLFHFWFNTFFLCPGKQTAGQQLQPHPAAAEAGAVGSQPSSISQSSRRTSAASEQYAPRGSNDELLPPGGVRSHIIVPSTSHHRRGTANAAPASPNPGGVGGATTAPIFSVGGDSSLDSSGGGGGGPSSPPPLPDPPVFEHPAKRFDDSDGANALQVRSHIRLDTVVTTPPPSAPAALYDAGPAGGTDWALRQQGSSQAEQPQPASTAAAASAAKQKPSGQEPPSTHQPTKPRKEKTPIPLARHSLSTGDSGAVGQANVDAFNVGCCSLNPRTYTTDSTYTQQKKAIYKTVVFSLSDPFSLQDLDDTVTLGSMYNRPNYALRQPTDPELAPAFHHGVHSQAFNVPPDHHCLTLCKSELDRACKDRRDTKFPPHLRVHLVARCCDEYEYGSWLMQQRRLAKAQQAQQAQQQWAGGNAGGTGKLLQHAASASVVEPLTTLMPMAQAPLRNKISWVSAHPVFSNSTESELRAERMDAEATHAHVCPLWDYTHLRAAAAAHAGKRDHSRSVAFDAAGVTSKKTSLAQAAGSFGHSHNSGHDIHWSSDSEDELDEEYPSTEQQHSSMQPVPPGCASQAASQSDSHSVGSAQECST